MSITIDLNHEELTQIKRLTRREDGAEAVATAAREFLRVSHLKELKNASGNVDFDLNWQEMEAIELSEVGPPQ
jgi:hypothetical protein